MSIIFVVDDKKANEIQKFWGDKFPMMAMEECAELQQAISKYVRYNKDDFTREDLIEEISDVIISISGLMERYYISDNQINEQIIKKMSMDKKKED